MNDINMIDSCQAHLPCNMLRTSNSFARSDTGVVSDSQPHLIHMCKTSLVFAPLAVGDYTGSSAFLFYSKKNVTTITY